ncbi:MAG TPA: RHS repeat-associated core domain-containing protein [Pyrinomonadaceae bacterium]|nr:RHS repeat-associated core domain-containing protein [Pyrinomonadaceae bacterium]
MMSNGGFVKARMDYTAYGENIGTGTGLRTTAQGFDSAINPRQQYGLTERDSATGLDHTPWRKNENRAGRWTSPDPFTGSASIGDPQSFNRYSYVGGDPINWIDPSGLNEATPVEGCSYSGKRDHNGEPVYDGHIVNGRCVSDYGTVQVFAGDLSWLFGGESTWNPVGQGHGFEELGGGSPTGGGTTQTGGGKYPTPRTQQDDLNSCIGKAIAKYLSNVAKGTGQTYLGLSMVAGGGAIAAAGYRFGIKHLGSAISAGEGINALAAPHHISKIALIGVPFFAAGYALADRGVNKLRLAPSSLDAEVRHCREVFKS